MAVFKDRRASDSRYRVCFARAGTSSGRCKTRHTRGRGSHSAVHLPTGGSGSDNARWIRGRVVAHWTYVLDSEGV